MTCQWLDVLGGPPCMAPRWRDRPLCVQHWAIARVMLGLRADALTYLRCKLGQRPASELPESDRAVLVWSLWARGWSDGQVAAHCRMALVEAEGIREKLGLDQNRPPGGSNARVAAALADHPGPGRSELEGSARIRLGVPSLRPDQAGQGPAPVQPVD